LAIPSPTSGGRSVGIVRSRTQTMEFSFFSDDGDDDNDNNNNNNNDNNDNTLWDVFIVAIANNKSFT
jgi:hypothetical protein